MVAAQGVKILGKDLEKTLAGLPLLVAYKEDEIPVLKVSYCCTCMTSVRSVIRGQVTLAIVLLDL